MSASAHGGGLRGRDLALVLVICVAWACNFLTSAFALREIPPFLFTAVRLSILALVLGFDPIVLDSPLSLVLMLVSAVFLAIGTVLMRRLSGVNMISQQGWTALISVVPLLLLSTVFEPGNWHALREATWIGWGGALYSAVFASMLGHGLYYVLVQRHPVAQVTPWLLLAPMLAVVLGMVFWGDRPGPRLWIGGAMVLGGVLIIALRALAKMRPLQVPEEI